MLRITIIIMSALILSACHEEDEDLNVTGMRPEYISYDELLVFEQQGPQEIVHAGKIMLYENYVFLGEINKGVHIIDISDTLNPVNISFLKIPGNKDVTGQDDRLYADNGPHLLILDITDIHHITMIGRSMNVFSPSEMYPREFAGYFECVNDAKGWVVGWEEGSLENPKCKTANM